GGQLRLGIFQTGVFGELCSDGFGAFRSGLDTKTPSGGNGSSGGKPSMTRSTTSMQRQSPSGQWLTVWASIAGPCASTSMPLNAHSPNHEADGRAFSTPTATTSWPVG